MIILKLLIDLRESKLIREIHNIQKECDKYKDICIEIKSLDIGDVILCSSLDNGETYVNVLIFERKTISDLFNSIRDGRYKEQSYRLMNCGGIKCHDIIYLIEGQISELKTFDQRDKLYSTIQSLTHFKGFSVSRSETTYESAHIVLNSYWKLQKEYNDTKKYSCEIVSEKMDDGETMQVTSKQTSYIDAFAKPVKKMNITPENINSLMLSIIPHVSISVANVLMKEYLTIFNLKKDMDENPNILYVKKFIHEDGRSKKINKTASDNINRLFLQEKIHNSQY